MIAISLQVNGTTSEHLIEARENLADVLRERCGLTGTHLGCEHGACGACTVAVDGEATRACILLAAMCEGRRIETIEGLRNDAVMAILRRHFHQAHAVQCGFCTPGMLIMARDILLRHRAPSPAVIRHELSGQICRCTGYAAIVAAIAAAAAEIDAGRSAASA
jgi:carbon-monoxide dehydrogenase small subunit